MPNNKPAQPQQNQNKEKASGEQEQHRRRRRRSRGGQGGAQQGQAAVKTAQQPQGKNAPAAEKNTPAKKSRGGQNSGQSNGQNGSQNNSRRQPQKPQEPKNQRRSGTEQQQRPARQPENQPGRKANATRPRRESQAEDVGLLLITRRPPKQKFANFEEYIAAHGGVTVPVEGDTVPAETPAEAE